MVESNLDARSLELGIAAVLDGARRLEAASKGRGLSFTDHLCGQLLPELFQIQFGAKATTARNGAYVRFAEAALMALGQKFQRETIIRSISAIKKARKKRVGKN